MNTKQELLKSAIDQAYQDKVKNLFDVLSKGVMQTDKDDYSPAEPKEKFRAGLSHLERVREIALEVARVDNN